MTASIVVLHYGQPALTNACLDSVDTDAQVVLVDNDPAYHHERVDLLIRPRSNTGYAGGCNLGAAVTSGDIIVFLNNDTVAVPGWLTALEGAFARDPAVGVVGAQLLYPDGTVQHAGVDLFRDRGMLHGRHANPALAGVRRPVSAVTGACMAVRRACWEYVAGFDEGFWNGNEDVDLCLRAHPWQVLYEPDAVLTHHESASGPERWVKVRENVQRLTDKWRDLEVKT